MQNIDNAIIWAHRGRNRIAPENTMAAFRYALDAGDVGIELDVALSADGLPVVIHDDSVDRTTDGNGLVSELSYETLNRLDAGSWFDGRFKGERLPLLFEVLIEARGYVVVNIEIKASAWRERPEVGIEVSVLKVIRDAGMDDSVLVSSFEWRSLRRIRSLDKVIPLGVLAGQGWDPKEVTAFAVEIGAFSIHPNVNDLIEGMPASYREFSGKIFPYTIKDAAMGERVIQNGAEGFFADLPFGTPVRE